MTMGVKRYYEEHIYIIKSNIKIAKEQLENQQKYLRLIEKEYESALIIEKNNKEESKCID